MSGFILLVLGLGLFLVAMHPFVTYPLSLVFIARHWPKPVRSGDPARSGAASVALCLCAFNEEAVIEAKIENMLAMRQIVPGLEVLVYVDCSSDRTAEIVSGYAGRIQFMIAPTRTGKTHGMNVLVSSTTAEIVVFTDANVLFARDTLSHLLRPFADPQVGCSLGHLEYVSPEKTATASIGSFYWRLEEKMKALESRSGSAITADGAIYAIRRVLHVAPPRSVADDIFISLAVMCAGYRVVRAGDAVAYEDISVDARQEFRRKIRIGCLAYNAHRLLWPQLRTLPAIELYKYVSHKLLRWFTIYLLAAAALCLVTGITLSFGLLMGLATAGVGAATVTIVTVVSDGPIGKIGSILEAFAATGLGIWRSYRGERFETWASPTRAAVLSIDMVNQPGAPAAPLARQGEVLS